jgi:hypothetical protein
MLHAQYHRLGLPVYASNRTLIREARKLCLPGARTRRDMRDARHTWLRALIQIHADARALVERNRL